MDLRQLRLFRLIYEAGSIVGASELERSAPSVLAHHLSNLEGQIGVPLFERSSRGMIPTDAGRRLYAHATGILRAVELAEQDTRDTGPTVAGSVEVAMAFSAVLGTGAPLMRRVIEAHPKLRLTIADSLSGSTVEHFLASEVDMAVAYSPSQDARLKLTPLLEEQMVCMGRPEVIGETDAPLGFEEFLNLRFILPKSGGHGRAVLDSKEYQKRLEDRAVVHTQNVIAAWLFISQGLGAMLGTKLYMSRQVAGPGIVSREVIAPSIRRTLYLCERKDRTPSRALGLVKELILDRIRDEVDRGDWPARHLA